MRSHGYVEASEAGFMLPGWVDRGADALTASGRLGARGEYFGHIACLSLVARKPA
jgi:hypothetical protein